MSGILLDHGKAGIIILVFCEVPLSWFGALANCDTLATYAIELVLGLEENVILQFCLGSLLNLSDCQGRQKRRWQQDWALKVDVSSFKVED